MRTLELFVDAGCLCEDKARGLVPQILKDFPDISFREIDLAQEPERARRAGVMMSPTLLLNGKIISVGLPEESLLRKILREDIR